MNNPKLSFKIASTTINSNKFGKINANYTLKNHKILLKEI
jgi:hypothetical protein